MSKVLKAKYFPYSTFLEANLGHRPSATWRGILKARDFVAKGVRSRVGNGQATRIWGSSWIPDDGHFRLFTPQPLNVLFPDRVSDLIDPITRTWRVELINALFWPVDIARILAIPIGAPEAEDRMVWHFAKDGKFSVRTCYKLIQDTHFEAATRPSGSDSTEVRWNFIWQLKVPPKIRMFVWRACANILPTKVALYRRHIVGNPYCDRCGVDIESLSHALFECRGSQFLWSSSPFHLEPFEPHVSMWAILEHLRKVLSQDLFLDALVVCWKIWELRNKELHGELDDIPRDIVSWSKEFRSSFLAAQIGNAKEGAADSDGQWCSPPPGHIKVNVDVAIPKGKDFFRVGLVARDSDGTVIWWKIIQFPGRPSPLDGEALAVYHGSILAKDKGWPQVIVETDCFPVFHAFSSAVLNRSLTSFGALIDACLVARSCFRSLLFSFVRRSGNSLAHSLATDLGISCNEGSLLPSGFS